jgi:DNA-binding NtrC family response regulator
VPVDVRVISASHRDLRRAAAAGRFRSDLYHRLAVLELRVPPLRERLDDLPLLVRALAPRLCEETGLAPLALSPEAWRALRAHHWPGNVRELHAVLARALLRSGGGPIGPDELGLADSTPPAIPDGPGLEQTMIESALREDCGNITRAAARIGWSRQKLYRRMRELGIERPA